MAMKPPSVKVLRNAWALERQICARLDDGGRLFRSQGGDFINATEENCLENRALLPAFMERQREMSNLDTPDIDSLKIEFVALHTQRASLRLKAKKVPKGLMEATAQLVQGNAHLDAKAFKRLMSYARHRFLRGKEARDAGMQCDLEGVCISVAFIYVCSFRSCMTL